MGNRRYWIAGAVIVALGFVAAAVRPSPPQPPEIGAVGVFTEMVERPNGEIVLTIHPDSRFNQEDAIQELKASLGKRLVIQGVPHP